MLLYLTTLFNFFTTFFLGIAGALDFEDLHTALTTLGQIIRTVPGL